MLTEEIEHKKPCISRLQDKRTNMISHNMKVYGAVGEYDSCMPFMCTISMCVQSLKAKDAKHFNPFHFGTEKKIAFLYNFFFSCFILCSRFHIYQYVHGGLCRCECTSVSFYPVNMVDSIASTMLEVN